MGNEKLTLEALFVTMKDDEEVAMPTFRKWEGRAVLTGMTMGCVFTIIVHSSMSASLSVSGANAELIIPGLRDLVTKVVGTEPLCQYDVHSGTESEMHITEWCMSIMEEVYLTELVNGGGHNARLQSKENLVLFGGGDPREYYSPRCAASMQHIIYGFDPSKV